jgi:hypothetical protein
LDAHHRLHSARPTRAGLILTSWSLSQPTTFFLPKRTTWVDRAYLVSAYRLQRRRETVVPGNRISDCLDGVSALHTDNRVRRCFIMSNRSISIRDSHQTEDSFIALISQKKPGIEKQFFALINIDL